MDDTTGSDTLDRVASAYRIEDICELLGCSYHYVYRHIRSGELPAYRISNSYRVARDDLSRWLDQRRVA